MYFIYKRESYDDMPHEGDGIAQTTDIYDILYEIKKFYEIQDDEIGEEVNKEHMLTVLRFLNEVLNLEGFPMTSFDPGIEKMINSLGNI